MTSLATDLPSVAPLQATPRAARFLIYWQQHRDEIDEITAIARRIALKDGRDVVCLNDCQAAWTQVIGPMWVD